MDAASRFHDWFDSIADRLGVTPASFVLGAAALVVAAAAGWWAFAMPDPPAAEEILPRVGPGGVGLPAADSPEPGRPVIVVHVDGAVMVPGVHELAADARVIDAVEAAQGLRADADQGRLNLAAELADGQRIWVPVVGEDEPTVVQPTGGGPEPGAGTGGATVDLNSADASVLETLPGVGPSIAGAILAHREEHGRFRAIDELLEVPGIGPARLAQLEPLVRV